MCPHGTFCERRLGRFESTKLHYYGPKLNIFKHLDLTKYLYLKIHAVLTMTWIISGADCMSSCVTSLRLFSPRRKERLLICKTLSRVYAMFKKIHLQTHISQVKRYRI